MRRSAFTICGREFNVARDWFMCLFWFFLLSVGPLVFVFVVFETPTFHTALPVWLMRAAEAHLALAALIACNYLYWTVVADPGVVLDYERLVDPEAQKRELTAFVGAQHAAAYASALTGAASRGGGGGGGPTSEAAMYALMDPHMCPRCQLYINKFDHHCGVIGAAIGERNMASFIIFLCYAAQACINVLIFSLWFLLVNLPSSAHLKNAKGVMAAVEPMMKLPFFCAAALVFIALYGGLYCTLLTLFYFHQLWQGQHSLEIRRAVARAARDGVEPPKFPKGSAAVASAFGELRRMVPMAARLRQLAAMKAAATAATPPSPSAGDHRCEHRVIEIK